MFSWAVIVCHRFQPRGIPKNRNNHCLKLEINGWENLEEKLAGISGLQERRERRPREQKATIQGYWKKGWESTATWKKQFPSACRGCLSWFPLEVNVCFSTQPHEKKKFHRDTPTPNASSAPKRHAGPNYSASLTEEILATFQILRYKVDNRRWNVVGAGITMDRDRMNWNELKRRRDRVHIFLLGCHIKGSWMHLSSESFEFGEHRDLWCKYMHEEGMYYLCNISA